jgi:hypothetical protein
MPSTRRPRFPPTSWSTLGRAGAGDPAGRRAALGDILACYLPVLRSHLVQVRRLPADAAGEILQGFVADKVLRDGLVGKADRTRGRFRSLLLRALENYLATQLARQGREPRLLPDGELPEQGAPATQHDAFDHGWACEVVRRALEGMRRECDEGGRADVWGLFEARVVGPSFAGVEAPPYEALVERFGIGTPRQAINLLTTGKRMFNRHLQREVAAYEGPGREADAEISDLRSILLRTAGPPG